MNEYFIKIVDAPGLMYMVRNGDKNEAPVEFSHHARNQCDQFSKCKGFLLYEKYRQHEGGVGSKCIFAIGHVKIPIKIELSNCHVEEKDFPTAIRTIIDDTLPAGQYHHGLSIQEINKICPGLYFRPRPKVGGLYPINKIEFDALSTELKNRTIHLVALKSLNWNARALKQNS